MFQSVHIDSKFGKFTLLLDAEDLDITKVGLRVHKNRVASGLILYIPTASKNGFNRCNQDCRFVHLLVVEKCLGRSLKKGEVVHHLNANNFDCRRSNLLVCRQNEHASLHIRMGIMYAEATFQSPLSGDQFQLLRKLLGRNTQDISGVNLVI